MLRPHIATAHRRRSRDAHAPAVADPEIRPCFFSGSGRLESPPLEGNRRPLEVTPQRIGAAVRAAPGQLDELRDHGPPALPGPPTSPPTSASSMRTCGAPSVTERGNWPALPQPPPIWFQRKSAAM